MRLTLAAACAALALVAPAPAIAEPAPSTATVPLANAHLGGVALTGACTWNGGVIAGAATYVAAPAMDVVAISVACTLVDYDGNEFTAHDHRTEPPAVATTTAAPRAIPFQFCGYAHVYFRDGYSMSAGECVGVLPGL